MMSYIFLGLIHPLKKTETNNVRCFLIVKYVTSLFFKSCKVKNNYHFNLRDGFLQETVK